MSGGRQRTLFQSWGTGASARQPRTAGRPVGLPAQGRRRPEKEEEAAAIAAAQAAPGGFEDGEDDDVLLVAVFEAERGLGCGSQRVETGTTLSGFDLSAGDVWIYPNNWPIRTYQFDMVHAALFHNTLVCLPTGLGKTFIAAVSMYNFYRWYPAGKIVFMAPTKPLVAQQIEACYKVMGIPQSHMAEMTGHTQALNRQTIWNTRRVFFLTPQVMMNDLSRGACPATDVKCLVVDEAHKALGNYAYCQVVKELCNYTHQFRVLALTATPGGDIKAVQQVISNLMISRLEVRSEDSIDIQPYSHQRHVEKFVLPLGPELIAVQSLYLQVLEAFTRRLLNTGAILHKDIANLTKYQIVLSREQFRKNPPGNIGGVQRGMAEGDYALCISLYHGYELLLQMGMRSLYAYLEGIMDGSKGMTRVCNELCRNAVFMEMYEKLKATFSSGRTLLTSQKGPENEKQLIYSHPKLQKLEEVVLNHFHSRAACGGPNTSGGKVDGSSTRVMIFSSYRHSVQEIAEMLSKHQPLVKAMTFVGHASGKNTKGFTQKEQLEVMRCFREGGYNVLVSTCVGEEGLDIGEVDLIICFDVQKSPIRMVQRMGRTGRKREGRIVVLLAEGREERTYNQSQCSKRSIYKTILGNGNKTFHLYANSPRMVPNGLNPAAHKMYITTGEYETNNVSRNATKHGRKPSILLPESFGYSKSTVNKQTKEDGLLTPEEFELWDRKFRLKTDLGTPKLLLLPFEYVKDEPKDMEQESGSIRELSLSEWSLWQNHPHCTHFVDHSDRCQHFISIMDMIDLMRQDESGCGYSLEIMPYLNRDDIFERTFTLQSKFTSTSSAKNGEKCIKDQLLTRHKQEKKKCKRINIKQHLCTLMDEDEECSLFNTSKLKRTKGHFSSSNPETVDSKEPKESAQCVSGNYRGKEASSEDAVSKPGEQDCQSLGETEVDVSNDVQMMSCFDLFVAGDILEDDMIINLNKDSVVNKSTNTKPKCAGTRRKRKGGHLHPEPKNDYVMKDIMTDDNLSKCNVLNSVESGHNSQLNETAVCGINLSKLFYLPESLIIRDNNIHKRSSNSGPGVEHSNYEPEHSNYNSIKHVPTSVEIVLENVKSFLNTSPPLEVLPFLEEVNYEENQPATSKTTTVNILNPSRSSSPPINIKSPALMTHTESVTSEHLNNHDYARSSSSWDDLFDSHVEYLDQDYKAQSSASEEEIFHPSRLCQTETEENKNNKIPKDSINDEALCENSLSLFEDNLLRANLPTFYIPNYKSCAITKDIPGLEPHVFNEPIQNAEATSSKKLENGDTEHKVTPESYQHKAFQNQPLFENIHVDQQILTADDSNSNKYNCSDELFSVNFDLAFSFEDIVKDADAPMTNAVHNKNIEFSEHFADKSENVEVTKTVQDECSNVAPSKLFLEGTKEIKLCSTPISLKRTSLQPGKMETWPCNEGQCSATQDLFSPICQLDRGVLFTSSPTFASITPEKKHSSPKFYGTTSRKPQFKNSPVTSNNAVHRDIEIVKNVIFSEPEVSPNINAVNCDDSGIHGNKSLINYKSNIFQKKLASPINGECNSESDEEVIRRPNKRIKLRVPESPEVTGASDIDSPMLAVRKQRKVLNASQIVKMMILEQLRTRIIKIPSCPEIFIVPISNILLDSFLMKKLNFPRKEQKMCLLMKMTLTTSLIPL
ncbi:Fanconi anemia group M protein isoform X2 [Amblyraja radiata]|uniref:Fanconi anemia group M protein isoform X2 n=1 Tax=Amblyraja radiata TaxID=386614 RepID=UPI00140275F1|nr:Fanconi anemia group M protein isoform X2 [Amblyraja radiata]